VGQVYIVYDARASAAPAPRAACSAAAPTPVVALRLALRFALRFAVPHKPDLDDLWTFGDRDTRTWPPKISTKIKTFVGVVRDKLIASGNELVIAKKRLDSKSATNKSFCKIVAAMQTSTTGVVFVSPRMRLTHGWNDRFLSDIKRLFNSWRLNDGSLPSVQNERKRKQIEIADVQIMLDVSHASKQSVSMILLFCEIVFVYTQTEPDQNLRCQDQKVKIVQAEP
jgi:hypothetical protein